MNNINNNLAVFGKIGDFKDIYKNYYRLFRESVTLISNTKKQYRSTISGLLMRNLEDFWKEINKYYKSESVEDLLNAHGNLALVKLAFRYYADQQLMSYGHYQICSELINDIDSNLPDVVNVSNN